MRRRTAGHLVVDRAGRGDHRGDAGPEQVGHLGPGRAAVEEDQLQAPLAPQEPRKPRRGPARASPDVDSSSRRSGPAWPA